MMGLCDFLENCQHSGKAVGKCCTTKCNGESKMQQPGVVENME